MAFISKIYILKCVKFVHMHIKYFFLNWISNEFYSFRLDCILRCNYKLKWWLLLIDGNILILMGQLNNILLILILHILIMIHILMWKSFQLNKWLRWQQKVWIYIMPGTFYISFQLNYFWIIRLTLSTD